MNIPQPSDVSQNFTNVPYVFVADDAFPLRRDILKPFRQAQLDSAEKEIFNYRLSRARHVVENAFGILASRFRIYHSQINLEPQNICKVVRATCVLHNFLMTQQPTSYAPPNTSYQEDTANGIIICAGSDTSQSNMMALQRTISRGNLGQDAKYVRNNFINYFNNENTLPWQHKRVHKNKPGGSTT